MTPRPNLRPLALLVATLWATAPAAPAAAADRYDEARAATQQAQTLQAAGRWPEARTLLENQGGACGAEDEGRACRLLVRFSLGYLAEREAGGRTPVEPELLVQAAAYYRAVLAEAPDHEATLKNLALVYRALQRPDEAEAALQQAAAQDRSGSGRAALMLGQLYRDTGRPDAAIAAYQAAAGAGPESGSALRALVEVYADLPPERAEELLQRAIAWEPTEPAVAATAYRRVIERSLPARAPLAERAVVRWAALLARNGWLSAEALAGLDARWPPLREMQGFVQDPDQGTDAARWWLQDAKRRSVLAEVVLALTTDTTDARTPPAPEQAVRRLEQAMRFCPRYDEYVYGELRNERLVRLDLSRELIALYARQPGLDAGGARQRSLINELFSGKGGAYESSDLAAIQRFHATLGQIYAQRGTWSGDGATNARFQFDNMLRIADRRERQDGYVQPLQDVKAQLAQGYETLQQPRLARAMHLRAAVAYLDTDQADRAIAALQQVARLASPPPDAAERRSIAVVRRIAATRLAVAEGAAVPRGAGGAHGWLFEPAAAVVGEAPGLQAFAGRQQYKALADLALRGAGAATDADDAAAPAFAAALRVSAMIGTADLIRLDKVKERATAHALFARRRTDIDRAAPAKDFAGKTWTLYVPAEPAPLYLRVGADAVLAGRLAAAWKADPALARKPLAFAIDAGRVAVSYPAADAPPADALDRLRAVPGVAGWTAQAAPR
jgi:tetratricopeptide (TPR) repeat protein